MESKENRIQHRLGAEIQAFRETCHCLVLATTDEHNRPNVSYAPFALAEKGYYILVSDLARHGLNLKQQSYLSLMMLEDESQSKALYARRRLSFDAKAHWIARDQTEWQSAIQALRLRHGEIIDNLSQLGDFNLYRLTPEKGRYVKGFGQAFNVSGEDLISIVHLDEGHVKKVKEQQA
jgi:hypothetical protein